MLLQKSELSLGAKRRGSTAKPGGGVSAWDSCLVETPHPPSGISPSAFAKATADREEILTSQQIILDKEQIRSYHVLMRPSLGVRFMTVNLGGAADRLAVGDNVSSAPGSGGQDLRIESMRTPARTINNHQVMSRWDGLVSGRVERR
jgi:hypothetical protein